MVVAVKAIVPKHSIADPKRARAAVIEALQTSAQAAKTDFDATTRTWSEEHKPTFDIIANDSEGKRLIVATRNEAIYRFVSRGTRVHMIMPRNKKMLAFRTGGAPKTQPNSLSVGSGRRGKGRVFSKGVRHPGIKARRFEELIAKKYETILPREIRKALAAALKP